MIDMTEKIVRNHQFGPLETYAGGKIQSLDDADDENIVSVLTQLVWSSLNQLRQAFSHPKVKPHHIDELIRYADGPVMAWFIEALPTITQSQMERLLSDDHDYVRQQAYNHPSCTEAQKVAYHLKYGE